MSEPQWQLSELKSETEPMLIRKLLDAAPAPQASSEDYVIYLTFGCNEAPSGIGFYTEEDSAVFADLDAKDIPELETSTGAKLVAVVSAPRVCDFIFYSSDPDAFLEKASPLRERFSQFQVGCQCSPDPKWSQYRSLPPADS